MANLVYPKALADEELNPASIMFSFFERKTVSSSSIDDTIQLYMPQSASQPSTVSWDSEKFGFVGNAIAKAGAESLNGGTAQSVINNVGKNTAGFGELLKLSVGANLGSAAAQLVGGNVTAEGLIGAVAGKVRNPYLTMVFRGIDFRSFAYTFRFYPFSESDCYLIDGIINTFRANALPDYEPGSAFLTYPKECQISYWWKGKPNPWLHRFKRSVCTAIDVDYTPSGMFSVMRNGFPAEIVVSTKWSEIEIVTRKDVNEGF